MIPVSMSQMIYCPSPNMQDPRQVMLDIMTGDPKTSYRDLPEEA